MEEIFKFIKDYGQYYMISNFGRVLSLRRGRPRFLKPTKGFKGYMTVDLYGFGYKKQEYVHRLVAKYFIDKKEGAEQVNHINFDKEYNHFSNLEWCTPEENSYHAYNSR